MTPEDAFLRYRQVLERLTAETMDSLTDVLSSDVRFRDSLHDVAGRDRMVAVFAHLFDVAENVDFEIDDHALSSNTAYFRWHLRAILSGNPWQVEGVTRVIIDDNGLVKEHVEYWDAASQLYERFPVLGSILRFVRRRVAGV